MCLNGSKVSHPRFGEGKILSLEKGYVRVDFGTPYGEKLFVYPDAFADFLTPRERALEIPIQQALADKRRDEAKRHAERLERLRALQTQAAAEKNASRATRSRTTGKSKPAVHS